MRHKRTTTLSRNLRSNSTEAERLLWRHIRAKQLNGFKFKRQAPIGNYIIDFVCFEKKLILEIDGGQHASDKKDAARETWLESQGFKVLRFWNNEVLGNIEGVLTQIFQTLSESPSPQSPPIKGGEA